MKHFSLLISSVLFLQTQSCMAQVDKFPKENWCIHKATDQNGDLVFITANLGYKTYAYKAEFPWCLEVNVTTVHKNSNGHPTGEEATVLNATEDIITDALQKADIIHFVGRVTVRGYRELYYFVVDPKKANQALTQLTKKKQPREWEYRISEDKQWERVASFFSDEECL